MADLPRQAQVKIRIMLVGLLVLVFYPYTAMPLIKYFSAKRWQPISCTVITSELVPYTSGKSDLKVVYRYFYNNTEHEADRLMIVPSKLNSESGQQILQKYQPASRQTCYVNPRRPSEAVLNRNFSTGLLMRVLPLAAAIVLALVCFKKASTPHDQSDPA